MTQFQNWTHLNVLKVIVRVVIGIFDPWVRLRLKADLGRLIQLDELGEQVEHFVGRTELGDVWPVRGRFEMRDCSVVDGRQILHRGEVDYAHFSNIKFGGAGSFKKKGKPLIKSDQNRI